MSSSRDARSAAASIADFIHLNEEIAALVRARLPLDSHLVRLAADLPRKSADLAQRVGNRIERGESLPTAIEAECASLPAAYRATIVAGVESGNPGEALESIVNSASRFEQLRRATGIAILYPLVIVITVCVLMAFIIVTFAPSFGWLNHPSLSAVARFSESPWIVPVLTVFAPAILILFAIIWWWRSGRVGGMRTARLGSLKWLPWVRRTHYWGQAATFADLLRLLVERGIPFDKALDLAGDAVDQKQIGRAAHELAARSRQGNLVPQAIDFETFRSERAFPSLIGLALNRLNDGRQLIAGLRQAADVYQDRAVRSAEWYAEYLPILLTVAIGGSLTIGFALLVFWPYVATLHEIATSRQWH